MTTDQLAAVIHLRDLGYSINEITPRGEDVVPPHVLGEIDSLIAQERMRQRLQFGAGVTSLREGTTLEDIRRDTVTPDHPLHSVRADSEAYALDDPKHPTYHDRMSDLHDMREGK